ncbi:MAG: histidine kinase dimerization/phospho-acceptor domain-containing protein [Deltaproteobacteria bacterium]|nr:histidine kinase dimerization/phospho-acceptor domain-containing protein [Deltaproteobacteria bacterium]
MADQGDPLAEVLKGLDHDLRNPVANILGFVDLVRIAQGAALTADQEMFLERIDDNCRQLLEMLEGLTAAAKRIPRS